ANPAHRKQDDGCRTSAGERGSSSALRGGKLAAYPHAPALLLRSARRGAASPTMLLTTSP
ncbi:MAG: hypothetical protein M3R24_08200, partial [Chloroflexota bacterium]|nr:hypothetical protein [Chloroflexota bacterium]